MNIHNKTKCDICQKMLKPVGYIRLLDGNICTSCAKYISPLIQDRSRCDTDFIKRHIKYRHDNEIKLREFNGEIRYGYDKKIYIDPNMYAFIVTYELEKNITRGNPDIIMLKDVTSCETFISEHILKHNESDVTYYDFYVDIKIDHEFCDEIKVRLNDKSINDKSSKMYNKCLKDQRQLEQVFSDDKTFAESIGFTSSARMLRL